MDNVNAICTNCGSEIIIDGKKDADICPHCNNAFVTEKAIKLYKDNGEEENKVRTIKRRHIWKSFLKGVWLVFKCFLYLFYVLMLMWLFFDIVDDIKK